MMLLEINSRANREKIKAAFGHLARDIEDINIKNGWRDTERSEGDLIALIHSEVSELLEWVRSPDSPTSDKIDNTGEAEELADILIRVIDYSIIYQIPLVEALLQKIRFNSNREYRHGHKKF